MGWLKKIRIGLLTLSVMLVAIGQTAFAADSEYYYTVRLYPGNQGTVSTNGITLKSTTAKINMEDDHVVISGLRYEDEVYINPQDAATVKDSRYHVRGVRRSGRDNSEATESAFPVASDRDYVIAYAVSGELVTYRVNYVDADGNALLASDTYYGNPNERQYVSARYVDGYLPQAMNLVKTLSTNEAENVFEFQYTPIEVPTTTTTTTTPENPEDTEATPAPAADDADAGDDTDGPGTPDDAGEDEGPDAGEDQGDVPVGGDVTLPDNQVPQGTQDLDDTEGVPLAKMKLSERPGTIMGYAPFYIAIGSMAVLALIVAAVYLKKRHVPAKASLETIREMVDKENKHEKPKEK